MGVPGRSYRMPRNGVYVDCMHLFDVVIDENTGLKMRDVCLMLMGDIAYLLWDLGQKVTLLKRMWYLKLFSLNDSRTAVPPEGELFSPQDYCICRALRTSRLEIVETPGTEQWPFPREGSSSLKETSITRRWVQQPEFQFASESKLWNLDKLKDLALKAYWGSFAFLSLQKCVPALVLGLSRWSEI